jgi:hypothetical protein
LGVIPYEIDTLLATDLFANCQIYLTIKRDRCPQLLSYRGALAGELIANWPRGAAAARVP